MVDVAVVAAAAMVGRALVAAYEAILYALM